MALTSAPVQVTTAASDDLLRRRSVWGSFIGGKFVVPADGETFTVVEAATGATMARVLAADDELVDLAVADARRAYEHVWRFLSPRERGALLREVAAHIRTHADELGELVAREVGKPKRDALRVDINFSHSGFDYFGGLTDTLHGQILDQGPIEARVVYEPYGVVAAILPFNWPPIHFTKKSAPALAAGNTVVVKPGEQAPLTVLRLVELANEVLPPGVINAVGGISAGPALAAHPKIERITFTGATATGRKVMETAAKNVTYTTLELGGKNALLVVDDADLDVAIPVAIEGMFYNQGEACTSTARILVHSSLHEQFTERYIAATADLVVGDPLHPATDIGPMVDAAQRDRVLRYLKIGLEEGARLLYEGDVPDDPRLAGGFWVAPRILGAVKPEMTVAQEEIFGPIACIIQFNSDDEAIEIANSSSYGLTAAICTQNETRAARIAQRLEAGMVFVNNYLRRTFLGAPFGGVKGSGYGRENAPETLHEFVRAKNVRFPSGRGTIPAWPPHQ